MIALITGATAGFGKATAELFAGNGWDVIICGRRKKRLEDLSKELSKKYKIKVLTLAFDIRKIKEVKEITSISNGLALWKLIKN